MGRVIVLRAFSFEKEGRMGPVCSSYVFMTFKNEETSMGAEFMLLCLARCSTFLQFHLDRLTAQLCSHIGAVYFWELTGDWVSFPLASSGF